MITVDEPEFVSQSAGRGAPSTNQIWAASGPQKERSCWSSEKERRLAKEDKGGFGRLEDERQHRRKVSGIPIDAICMMRNAHTEEECNFVTVSSCFRGTKTSKHKPRSRSTSRPPAKASKEKSDLSKVNLTISKIDFLLHGVILGRENYPRTKFTNPLRISSTWLAATPRGVRTNSTTPKNPLRSWTNAFSAAISGTIKKRTNDWIVKKIQSFKNVVSGN